MGLNAVPIPLAECDLRSFGESDRSGEVGQLLRFRLVVAFTVDVLKGLLASCSSDGAFLLTSYCRLSM